MHVLPQEIGLDSFSTYKNSMYGVNDNVPDNEDLLDFLVHLHDDALDLSEAPVQPSSKTSVYSTCKDSNTNLRVHGNDQETAVPASTQSARYQENGHLVNTPVPFLPAAPPQSPGNRQAQLEAQGTGGSDCSPPEGMNALLVDTDGTMHTPLHWNLYGERNDACLLQSAALQISENSGSASPMETKQEKSARLKREKNKRNQQKFRDRCRVQIQDLQGKIEATKGALHQQLSNRRRLQSEKAALLHSLLDVGSSTTQHVDMSKNQSSYSTAPSVGDSMISQTLPTASDAGSQDFNRGHGPTFSEGVKGVWNSWWGMENHVCQPQGVCFVLGLDFHNRISRQLCSAADVVKHARQNWEHRTFGASSGPRSATPAPISSYEQCAALSYRLLEKHLLPGRLWKSNPHSYIAQAVNDHQAEVAAATRIPIDRTCWFLHSDYEVAPGVIISCSSGLNSPECNLSATLVHTAMVLQSVFLVAEHEYLESVSGTPNGSDTQVSQLLSSCLHSVDSMHADHPHMHQGEQPDPCLLRRLRVRVNVNSSWPLADAVRKVVEPAIAECKATLPPHRWKQVAQMVTHVMHANLRAFKLQMSSKSSSDHGRDSSDGAQCMEPPVDTSESLSWGDLDQAMLALQQHTLCTTLALMWEGELQPRGRTLEDIERQMFTHWTSCGLSKYACMVADRVRVRSMVNARVMRRQYHLVQAQRIHSKLYKFLSLHPHQRDSLAARWHAWCRRRCNMDQPFLAAALELQILLEPSTQLEQLMLCACTVAHAISGPGDALAGKHSEPTTCVHAQHASQSSTKRPHGFFKGVLEPDSNEDTEHFSEPLAHAQNEEPSMMHAWEDNGEHDALESETESDPVMLMVADARIPSSLNASRISSQREVHDAPPSSQEGASKLVSFGPLDTAASHQASSSKNAYIHECSAASSQLEALLDTAGGAPQTLGQCGARVGAAQAAVQALLHVHHTDDLMQLELLTPLWELTAVQHARLSASSMTLGVSYVEVLQLCHMAAGELRQEELFNAFAGPWL